MRMLLFLAVIVKATAAMEQVSKNRCVHTCECTWAGHQIDVRCHDGKWPPIYPMNTAILNLSGNPLLRVSASSLHEKGLANLTRLDLSNCSLTYVDPQAFQGFQHLKTLDLSFNPELQSLTAAHFNKLANLEVVRLAGNNRGNCQKLRKELPHVKFHCGRHVTTMRSLTISPTKPPTSRVPSTTPEATVSSTEMPTPVYTESSTVSELGTEALTADQPKQTIVNGGVRVEVIVAVILGGSALVALVAFFTVKKWRLREDSCKYSIADRNQGSENV